MNSAHSDTDNCLSLQTVNPSDCRVLPLIASTLPDVVDLELLILIFVGFSAGLLGGLLGIGGSVIMIPVLTVLLNKSQHLSQAAAMIVNVFVAAPSAWRHHIARSVRWDVFWRMLPAGVVLILVGVNVSDLFHRNQERWLTFIFGLFLLYVIATNLLHLQRGKTEPDADDARVSWWRVSIVGAITGFMAGLLGIGGGIITVPLLQRITRLPLRQCIGTSSAVMCITAVIGAARKNMTLNEHFSAAGIPLEVRDSLLIAACLAPTAVIGGLIGARLTHTLKLKWVRLAFLLLLALAAARMVGQPLFNRGFEETAQRPPTKLQALHSDQH